MKQVHEKTTHHYSLVEAGSKSPFAIFVTTVTLDILHSLQVSKLKICMEAKFNLSQAHT